MEFETVLRPVAKPFTPGDCIAYRFRGEHHLGIVAALPNGDRYIAQLTDSAQGMPRFSLKGEASVRDDLALQVNDARISPVLDLAAIKYPAVDYIHGNIALVGAAAYLCVRHHVPGMGDASLFVNLLDGAIIGQLPGDPMWITHWKLTRPSEPTRETILTHNAGA